MLEIHSSFVSGGAKEGDQDFSPWEDPSKIFFSDAERDYGVAKKVAHARRDEERSCAQPVNRLMSRPALSLLRSSLPRNLFYQTAGWWQSDWCLACKTNHNFSL